MYLNESPVHIYLIYIMHNILIRCARQRTSGNPQFGSDDNPPNGALSADCSHQSHPLGVVRKGIVPTDNWSN